LWAIVTSAKSGVADFILEKDAVAVTVAQLDVAQEPEALSAIASIVLQLVSGPAVYARRVCSIAGASRLVRALCGVCRGARGAACARASASSLDALACLMQHLSSAELDTNATQIVEALRAARWHHAADSAVLRAALAAWCACVAVLRTATTAEARATLAQGLSLDCVAICVQQLSQREADVHRVACGALAALVARNEPIGGVDFREAVIAAPGAIPALVRIARYSSGAESKSDPIALGHALRALRFVAADRMGRLLIVGSEITPALLRMLSTEGEEGGGGVAEERAAPQQPIAHVEDAALILARVAQDVDSVAGLLRAGALPTLVARCRSEKEGEEAAATQHRVAAACAIALCNLSTTNDRGAFDPYVGELVALVRRAPSSPDTAAPLARMIANLAASTVASKTMLAENGALEAVHATLSALLRGEASLATPLPIGAAEELLGALATLACRHGANAQRLAELGVVPLALELLGEEAEADAAVVEGCATMLANMFDAEPALVAALEREERDGLGDVITREAHAAYRLSAVLSS